MNGFSYTLRLLEPVLANSLAGDINSARTLPFIPGGVIRGAMIECYQDKYKSARFDCANSDARRLFFGSTTRFLHANPEIYGERSLPVPLSWRRLKHERLRIFDFSVNAPGVDQQFEGLGENLYIVLKEDTAYYMDRAEHVSVHTQRDAIMGRATAEHGAVYRYEALPSGLVLRGAVLADRAEDSRALIEIMEGRTLLISKAKTAGYGHVSVEEVKVLPDDWREIGGEIGWPGDSEDQEDSSEYGEDGSDTESPQVAKEDETRGKNAPLYGRISLTLLSDAIVRDAMGHYTLDPIDAVRNFLGGRIRFSTSDYAICRKAQILGGFNRKWGTPLPQSMAIAAGSVFIIEADEIIDPYALRKLELEGIGDRRSEGMGRVACNWQNQAELWLHEFESGVESQREGASEAGAIRLSDTEKELADKMLTRALRSRIDVQLAEAAHHVRISGRIPNSQLSRYRGILRSSLTEDLPEKRIERLTQFLAKEKEKASSAWERMRRARVMDERLPGREDRVRLTEWLELMITDPESPWAGIGSIRTPSPCRLGEGVQAEINESLSVEYRIRLIDAVLARKAKQQARQVQEEEGND